MLVGVCLHWAGAPSDQPVTPARSNPAQHGDRKCGGRKRDGQLTKPSLAKPPPARLLPQVLLDCCQSVPNRPVDVQALGADWIVASSHKMCGPTGIGFLWGK